MSQHLQYYIDIVGTCNLACPSCPVGNFQQDDFINHSRPRGVMSLKLFQAILDKIAKENTQQHPIVICLYNWGEPLLHPKLPQFIDNTKQRGFYVDVSSNFNSDNIQTILQSPPDKLIISVSGYQQQFYQQTHRKGNIDKLLSNLKQLSEYVKKHDQQFLIEIFYHLYQHNVGEDIEKIYTLCEALGFAFFADVALFMPLEKNISYFNQHIISATDQELLDKLLVKPHELVLLAKPYQQQTCFQHDIISIRFDGSVSLCFPSYDYHYTVADNFLEFSQPQLLQRKKNHSLCQTCQSHALNVVVNFGARDALNKLIDQRLSQLGSNFRMEQIKPRRFINTKNCV